MSPTKEIVTPAPIIRKPKYVAQEEDSIAARLKARRAASSTNTVNAHQASATKVSAAADESIAE
eukprot:scaffold216935_cov20-Cyclotella_meneghiniana.AAC.1